MSLRLEIAVRVRLPWRARLLLRIGRVLLALGVWALGRAVRMVEAVPVGERVVGAAAVPPSQPQSPTSQPQ